jgi:uncharacterized membrane protein (DUF485 family)
LKKENLELEKDFVRLVKLQNTISVIFSLFILFIYFTFIGVIGFKPELFSFTFEESSMTFGILSGLSIIITSIFLTLLYVIISNYKLDKIRNKILKND